MTIQEKITRLLTPEAFTKIKNCKTIQLCLLNLDITIKDIQDIKKIDEDLYNIIKKAFYFRVAMLFELTITLTRNISQMNIVANQQQDLYYSIFQEDTSKQITMPTIIIKPSDATTLNRIDLTKLQQEEDTPHTPGREETIEDLILHKTRTQ